MFYFIIIFLEWTNYLIKKILSVNNNLTKLYLQTTQYILTKQLIYTTT